ncbi:hypothetical protein Fmac_011754 [Flemingia macrophylla]|uniref:Uncharacterized protein n=1 Tax=Flemingia macrophylla TaxID=520843 RepID=A0ABD1MP59_9FABA
MLSLLWWLHIHCSSLLEDGFISKLEMKVKVQKSPKMVKNGFLIEFWCLAANSRALVPREVEIWRHNTKENHVLEPKRQ